MASQITAKQIEDIREAFTLFDKDGNNLIDVSELGTVMRSIGQNPTEEELKDMIADVDENENGKIDFPEFIKMVEKRFKDDKDEEAEMLEAFRVFDRDGDGFISKPELQQIMLNLGEKLTEEEVEIMLHDTDLDGDGRLNYQEFVKAMVSQESGK